MDVGHSSAIAADKLPQKKRKIRTLVDLQRAYNAAHRRTARLYSQSYILQPALRRNLARFDELDQISDPAARFQAFRRIPPLEYNLEAVHSGLGPERRKSLAQQGRAKHPRVRLTHNGATLEAIIRDLLGALPNYEKRKAKEYWAPLSRELDQLGLNPVVVQDPADPSREKIEYNRDGKRRTLTLGQFQNIVSRLRRQARTLN